MPRTRQLPDQRRLFASQGWVRGERSGDGLAQNNGHALMLVLGHGCEQGLFGGQQRPGRVPQLISAVGQFQRQLVTEAAGSP